MKKFSKILSVALLVALVLSLGVANAFAAQTLSIEGAANGETYTVYKMLDLVTGTDGNGDTTYRYTLNDTWKTFWTTGAGKDYIDTNTSGTDTYVVWKEGKDTAAEMEAFGKAAAAFAATLTANQGSVVAADDAAEFDVDDGYYLVTSTRGTAATVASVPGTDTALIKEKNPDNNTEKKVQEAAERNGTAASWGTTNDAAVGDTVNFRSKVTIVKNSTNVKYHDTMTDGLTWSGTAVVYTDEACTTALANENYSVAAGTAPETFVVTFTQAYLDSISVASVNLYIAYSAVLNDKAVVAGEELNTPKITWGNNGEDEGTPTKTTTHKFEILKYDGADAAKNPLAGAKFQLFTVATGGTALKLAKNAAGTIYRVVDALDTTALPEGFTMTEDDKIVTLASGNITVEGVDSDEYYLAETDAPTGFNAIEGRIKVEVNAKNELIKEVENNSGTVLPSTGGIGTTIFYVVGGVLVLAAIILLVTKKRMSE